MNALFCVLISWIHVKSGIKLALGRGSQEKKPIEYSCSIGNARH